MTTCFCGCNEEIGRFQRDRRRANEAGAEISLQLLGLTDFYAPWLNAGRPGFEALPPPPEFPTPQEHFNTTLSSGGQMRDACLAVVHQIPGAETPSKDSIRSWVDEVEMLVVAAKMPLELRTKFANALAHGTAEEVVAAYEAGKRAG